MVASEASAKIAALEAACATVLQQHTGSSPLSTALPSSAGGAVPGAPPAPALVDELRKLQAQLAVVKRCVDDEAAPLTASQPTEDYGFIGHRRALRFAPQSADMATAIDEYGEKGPYEDEDDEDDEEGEEAELRRCWEKRETLRRESRFESAAEDLRGRAAPSESASGTTST